MQVRHSDKVRKNAFLTLLDGQEKAAAPCPHFLEGCGGCLLQDHGYAAQVAAKARYLSEHYGRAVDVVPCPDPFGYRNRMDFVKAFGKHGLRKRGKFAHVVDIKGCLLLPEAGSLAYAAVRGIIAAHGIEGYNYIRHEGFLKYTVIRMSRESGELMVILTTVVPTPEQEASFKEVMEEIRRETGAASVWWTTVKGKADMSVGEPRLHIGADHIIDTIAGRRFMIAPNTFFQANTAMAGTLFTRAAQSVQGDVLDLYCGVGVISAIVAPHARSVVGVELNPESVRMARENAALNSIGNAEFHAADAAAWLSQSARRFDTVIVDPARPGLGKAAAQLLLELAAQRIIYISCNPLTHKDDLDLLARQYDIVELKGYDLFPQTPHIEVLSILERKPSA